jgi:hypothetical protein
VQFGGHFGDGGAEDVDGGADEVDGGGLENPVLRVKLGVGVLDWVLLRVTVRTGTLAVLCPPVIICFVAIGRFGLPDR